MDALDLLCAIGVTAAFGFGACACRLATERARRAPAARGGASAFAARLARRGVRATAPLARKLLRVRAVGELAGEAVFLLAQRGVDAVDEAVVSAAIAGLAALGVIVGVLASSPVAGLACAACACAVGVVWLRGAQDRRREQARDAVPEVLRLMSTCFRAGYSLLQTFRQVADETQGTLHELFDAAAHRLEVGQGNARALEAIKRDASVPELAFVAVALDVQRQTGGSMQRVLDAAGGSVEEQIELERSLRVQTAQAQLSARVVSVMPFVLVALLSLMSPGYLDPFFESATGWALLGLALGLELAGVVAVRRMLHVELT